MRWVEIFLRYSYWFRHSGISKNANEEWTQSVGADIDDEAFSHQGSGSSFSASSFIFCSCMRLRTEPTRQSVVFVNLRVSENRETDSDKLNSEKGWFYSFLADE